MFRPHSQRSPHPISPCLGTSARAVPQTPGRTIAPSELGWEPDLKLFLSREEENEVLRALRECPDAGQVMEEAHHVASHEAVKRIPRPEQRPQSGPVAPSERRQCTTSGTHPRAHQEHAQRDHRALSSVTRAASRVISSADPAASRAVQCHPRGHQVPTERHQQRQQQRQPRRTRGHQPHNERHQELATSAHRAASFAPPAAPTERHQQRPQRHPRPTHSPTSGYHRAPSSRATAVPTERSPHRSALPRAAAHQPRSPSAIRSASLSSAHRAASAPSVVFSAHQQRPSSGVSAQQAPSAAPTERQSPRPQQRRRSPAALTERQRERQPQPHRSATASRKQHLSCARRITPLVAPSAQSRH
ncbi:serine/arginine repetitive matrix protein 1-like [Drosophila suzukii]|uniref:Serine/arginine repetitive matrix protein 1-like n=1 Tax=Drosophila suzukii TaxID=28584 RepID=A0ABM4TYQ1_DROSZ